MPENQPPLFVLPDEPLLAVELSLEDEGELLLEPLGELLLELLGWSLLLEEDELPGVLELGELELPPLSFFARLPLEEPDEPDGDEDAMPDEPEEPDDEPDCERRESLLRSHAESPKLAAIAAAIAVRNNLLCSMSRIS